MPSKDKKPINHNAGAFYLQSRSISVITVQTATPLITQHIYALNASNDLPLGLISLAVDHKFNHIYLKSLCKPIPNTKYDRVSIPRATVFSTMNPVEIASTEVSNISWTTTEKSQDNIRNSPTELPTIPSESSFQLKCKNLKRHSVILQDTQVPQEAREKLSSLLKNELDIIISKPSTNVGRMNLFGMDIQTTGSPIACKSYPILLKYQKLIGEEKWLLENIGCSSKSLFLWAAPVIIFPKKQDPSHPKKQQLHLFLDYHLLNKSQNAACNGSTIVSY